MYSTEFHVLRCKFSETVPSLREVYVPEIWYACTTGLLNAIHYNQNAVKFSHDIMYKWKVLNSMRVIISCDILDSNAGHSLCILFTELIAFHCLTKHMIEMHLK